MNCPYETPEVMLIMHLDCVVHFRSPPYEDNELQEIIQRRVTKMLISLRAQHNDKVKTHFLYMTKRRQLKYLVKVFKDTKKFSTLITVNFVHGKGTLELGITFYQFSRWYVVWKKLLFTQFSGSWTTCRQMFQWERSKLLKSVLTVILLHRELNVRSVLKHYTRKMCFNLLRESIIIIRV